MQALIAAMALLVGAGPGDREKLRQSIQLPSLAMKCGVYLGVTNRGEITLPDRNVSLRAEIAAVEESLRGDAADAGRYRTLADLYNRANEKEKSRAALTKAASLYRAQCVAQPHNGLLLAGYADCLESWHLPQRDEAEMLLRQALQLAPAEWECQVFLGGLLEQKANDVLAGGESTAGHLLPALLEQRAREGKITAEAFHQAGARFTESLQCFDHAVALAPREPTVYLARAGFRNNRALGGMIGKLASGATLNAYPITTLADACADLARAAVLKPDDWATVSVASLFEVMTALLASKEKSLNVQALPANARAVLRASVARLEKVAAGAEPLAAARVFEVLGTFYLMAGEVGKAEESVKRALHLNPDLDQAWDMLIGLLSQQQQSTEELLRVSRARLRHRDSARNRFLLAKAYDCADRPDEAIQVLEPALARDPDNYLCNLALAALLMRRDDRDLKRAGMLLDRAEKWVAQHPTEESILNYAVLKIAHLALNGQGELAERLRHLSPERRADSRMQELAKLLER